MPPLNRLCTLILALVYTVATGLVLWYSYRFYYWSRQITQVTPFAVAACFNVLALYAWSELVAMLRTGRPRFRLTFTLPLSIVLFGCAVSVAWPYRRVTSSTRIVEDLRILPAESQTDELSPAELPATPAPE